LPGRFCNNAEKFSGRLVAEMQFSTVEEVFDSGLHDYLDQLQAKLNVIGDELYTAYISHAFDLSSEEHFVQQEEQQQQCN
jgi:uncharacterized alpha-E superfamily protein